MDLDLKKKVGDLVMRKSKVGGSQLDSLRKGNWVKLICGASFQDVIDIRNLSLIYTLAGGTLSLSLYIYIYIITCLY